MEFEFDPIKSSANKIKHGIDFVEAQRLWEDGGRVTIRAHSFGEPRFAVIARVEQAYWVAFLDPTQQFYPHHIGTPGTENGEMAL